ncbi:MAG: alpha/beta hydrolase [Acutalibacteraceae bacterium]|nr:alpha/beta hydrolase [Acutalibacteraceae bacterium]
MIHEKLYLKDYYSFLGEDGRNPYLETYLPFNLTEMHRENRKRPCMVVCPGGGYSMCSQRESEPVALKFLADGYNVFVINYSVAPHRFPCQLREVAAVMELIYKNADAWNCDTEKIAIIGFSAGGHLAAHYSTMYDCKEVREVFPDSKPVNASVLSYPVISADRDFAHMGSFKNLLGHEPDEQEVKYFSCNNNVKENTPPAFLWHTAEDNSVPVKNSLVYAEALAKYKIPFELHVFPYGAHGLSTCDDQSCDNINDIHKYNTVWIDNAKKWLRLIFKI